MDNNSTKKGLATVLGTAAVLLLSFNAAAGAAAEPSITDEQKQAQEGTTMPGIETGYTSSLTEESQLHSTELSQDTSPGAFMSGDQLTWRVFADVSAPDGIATMPSRFTKATLNDLEQQLSGLAGTPGVFFGFGYRADTDTVLVTGNLPLGLLPSDAVSGGALVHEYTTDGGRE